MAQPGRPIVLRWLATPSTCFAGVVFACGWLPTSPFARWSNGLIFALSAPAMVAFVSFVVTMTRQRQAFASSQFRWDEVLSPQRAIIAAALAIAVASSFVLHLATYRGSPDVIDGEYVLMDHGQLVDTLSRSEWLRHRTAETRVLTGHFVLFGTVGILAQSPSERLRFERLPTRPVPRRRRPPGVPGGPGQP